MTIASPLARKDRVPSPRREDIDSIRPPRLRGGLAIYDVGAGEPGLLMPYPHGYTLRPIAEEPLARLLVGMDRRIITFDPPGAFRSTRPPRVDVSEMLECAAEALDGCQVAGDLDVVGHSMGGLCALACALERAERVRRLVLIGSVSGGSAAVRAAFDSGVDLAFLVAGDERASRVYERAGFRPAATMLAYRDGGTAYDQPSPVS